MKQTSASWSWLLLVTATIAHAQQMPPRDTPRPTEKGRGVIRGVVVDAQTGEPLPRTQVTLSRMGASGRPTAVQTDAEGRFEFREVPAGRHQLSASRVPYLVTLHGQRGPERRGTSIEVANGQVVAGIRIAMTPGGVISGRAYDEFGLDR